MGLISIGGLGSGLDITSIVGALVDAERAPKQNSLDRLETDVTVTLTGLGGLSSALDELRTSALDLSLNSNFDKRKVSVSDSTYFSATAASGASVGKYDIEVSALAQGSSQQSKIFTGGSTTAFGAGTLTFTIGTQTFDVAVTAGDTLDTIRGSINSAVGNDFVSVNLLNNVSDGTSTGSLLNFNSSTTGLGNDLVVTYSGDVSLADLSTNLTQTQAAGDASIVVDGLTATSSTNTFTNIIQDITLDVKKVHSPTGTTDSLDISLDTAATSALISNFVDTFNAFTDVTKSLGAADPSSPGLLVGDYTLRQVTSQIRNLLSSTVSTVTGDFNSLSSIGITTTRDGKLEINPTTFDDAVNNNFDQLGNLFTGSEGFGTKLYDLISNYTGSNGVITQRTDALNNQLDRVADDRISLNLRIEKLQFRLTKQFSAMDALVAQFNSTQSYITQQFDNLPGFGGKKK